MLNNNIKIFEERINNIEQKYQILEQKLEEIKIKKNELTEKEYTEQIQAILSKMSICEDLILKFGGVPHKYQKKDKCDIQIVTGVFFSWEGKEEKVLKHLQEFSNNEWSKKAIVYLVFNNETKDSSYIQQAKEILSSKGIEYKELHLKTRKMTGWKPKLFIYKQALSDFDKVIYIDLDIKLLKDLDKRFSKFIGKAKYRYCRSSLNADRLLNCIIYMSKDFSEYIDKAIKKSADVENCDDEISLKEVLDSDMRECCEFGPLFYEYFKFN